MSLIQYIFLKFKKKNIHIKSVFSKVNCFSWNRYYHNCYMGIVFCILAANLFSSLFLSDASASQDNLPANNIQMNQYQNYYVKNAKTKREIVEMYLDKGDQYLGRGEYLKAMQTYNHSLKLDPLHIHALYRRGDIWYEMGNYLNALKDYTKAIKLQPRQSGRTRMAKLCRRRAVIWYNLGYYKNAVKDFSRALKDEPDPFAYYHRGNALLKMGDVKGALKDAKKALQLKPNEMRFKNFYTNMFGGEYPIAVIKGKM